MRYPILAAASFGLLAAACSDSREPTAPAAAAPNAVIVTTCPATSPVQQIEEVIAFVQDQPAISPTVEAVIVARLEAATSVLAAGNTSAVITLLRAIIAQVEASSLPEEAKQAIIAGLNCAIAALSR